MLAVACSCRRCGQSADCCHWPSDGCESDAHWHGAHVDAAAVCYPAGHQGLLGLPQGAHPYHWRQQVEYKLVSLSSHMIMGVGQCRSFCRAADRWTRPYCQGQPPSYVHVYLNTCILRWVCLPVQTMPRLASRSVDELHWSMLQTPAHVRPVLLFPAGLSARPC
jgi:hypothetical protein